MFLQQVDGNPQEEQASCLCYYCRNRQAYVRTLHCVNVLLGICHLMLFTMNVLNNC